jgi:transcriptional regulatory protein LevR
MADQLVNNPEALRLFFNDDIFLVQQGEEEMFAAQLKPADSQPVNVETPRANSQPVPNVAIPSISLGKLEEEVNESIVSLVQEPVTVYKAEVSQELHDELNTVAEKETSNTPVELTFEYKGKNGRNILFLVYDERNEVTTDEGRELFKNIVKAKELTANDYAILNYALYKNSSFNELRRFFNAQAILTFGVNASQLGITDYPQHTVISHEGVKLLFSADLHELSMDSNIKRALWSALKDMKL